ncbi:MAG: MASE1 domain-containing protein [Opitutaceae bacterium]|nr:MASE1 domain-containing protein [Opitutaceae bacterium]
MNSRAVRPINSLPNNSAARQRRLPRSVSPLKNPTSEYPAKTSVRHATAACLLYLLLHLAAHLSARWFEVVEGVSLWYPPCGLALVLLLLLGPRAAPVVFAANTLGAIITPGISHWWDPWLFPLLITAVVTAVAAIVRRLHGPILLPGGTRETVLFAVVTVGTPALLALPGTALAVALDLTPAQRYLETAIRWWVGDASGVLTILPIASVLAAPWLGLRPTADIRQSWTGGELAELAGRMLVLSACLAGTFVLDPRSDYSAFFLCFLPLVWISVRHGLPGATAATLVLTMGSLIGLHLTEAATPQVVSFLIFEVTVAVVGLGIGVTVSRRDAAETRVLASEARLERVLNGAQLGLWDWDIPTGRVTYNNRCAEMLEVDLARLGGVEPSWQEFAHPADRPRLSTALADHLAGRSALYEIDFRVRASSGTWRWIHARGSVVARDAAGAPLTVSGTHLDVTDRLSAEAEARRLMQIIEVTTDFVLTTDLDGRIVHANAAFLRFLARPSLASLRGRMIDEIIPTDTLRVLHDQAIPAALLARSWLGETTLRAPSGDPLPVSLVVILHHGGVDDRELLSYTMRDLSQQKATEAEKVAQERRLQQLQRNESLGVLAGGVAHEFNNLLTTVLGNANLARLDLPETAPQNELLEQVEAAATRAGELCQLLLAYAGRSTLAFTDVDLTGLVEDTRDLLLVSAGRHIDVRFDLTRPLPLVHAAHPQIQQVLMNLVVNAAQAIGERPGHIVVSTRLEHLNIQVLSSRALTQSLTPGDYVILEVRDDGPGIAPEARARIFEPFFTTKFTGQGLGLPAAHGIVRSHEGAIEVLTDEGRGSTFRIYLPAMPTHVSAASSGKPPAGTPVHRGLVLVVDDEPGVRRTATRLIQSLGYETIGAANGEEGLEQFRHSADRLRAVLLDLTMPRMDGETAFAEMRKIRPAVPVVMMSGYSERLTPERYKANPPAAFLPKPFDRQALQAVLDGVVR